jgi:hypothetical protein
MSKLCTTECFVTFNIRQMVDFVVGQRQTKEKAQPRKGPASLMLGLPFQEELSDMFTVRDLFTVAMASVYRASVTKIYRGQFLRSPVCSLFSMARWRVCALCSHHRLYNCVHIPRTCCPLSSIALSVTKADLGHIVSRLQPLGHSKPAVACWCWLLLFVGLAGFLMLCICKALQTTILCGYDSGGIGRLARLKSRS